MKAREHPILKRYRDVCRHIERHYGGNPNKDEPLPANISMTGLMRIPPPKLDLEIAVLLDDMAIAVTLLSELNDWRDAGELMRNELVVLGRERR